MSQSNLFEGIKVLAVARQIAAPFATYQLAMHGAEVLTIATHCVQSSSLDSTTSMPRKPAC